MIIHWGRSVDVMDPSETMLDNTLCIAMEMVLCERCYCTEAFHFGIDRWRDKPIGVTSHSHKRLSAEEPVLDIYHCQYSHEDCDRGLVTANEFKYDKISCNSSFCCFLESLLARHPANIICCASMDLQFFPAYIEQFLYKCIDAYMYMNNSSDVGAC